MVAHQADVSSKSPSHTLCSCCDSAPPKHVMRSLQPTFLIHLFCTWSVVIDSVIVVRRFIYLRVDTGKGRAGQGFLALKNPDFLHSVFEFVASQQ